MAEVELPQLGESVTEAVITAWLVEVGDTVEVDQPLLEISTDKVDTEIPSPVAGTLSERKAEVDDTINVGDVIAVITTDDTAADDGDGDADGDGEADTPRDTTDDKPDDTTDETDDADTTDTGTAKPADAQPAADAAAPSAPDASSSTAGILASPLVRRLLREAGVPADRVPASGPGGRITRQDAERAIASGATSDRSASPGTAGAPAAPAAAPPSPSAAAQRRQPPASPTTVDFGGERQVTQELSRVRKVIARSMLESLQTTAQLTAVVEVDLTAIMNLRAARKDAFKAAHGASLSPLPIISRAVCMVLPRHPVMNASIDTDAGTVTYHSYVNLGMAVDTERGLLVPNVKDAQDLTVPGLARAIADLAGRARDRKLQPDEISGGTFTVTNTGSVGTLLDTPILNPPEVAILATCLVEKRPVVVSDAHGDAIAIRWMSYLSLSYDHRMVDGADAARFLQDLKYVLETHDFSLDLGV